MSYLKLVTLETLITPLKEEDGNDILVGLSIFLDGAMKLDVL